MPSLRRVVQTTQLFLSRFSYFPSICKFNKISFSSSNHTSFVLITRGAQISYRYITNVSRHVSVYGSHIDEWSCIDCSDSTNHAASYDYYVRRMYRISLKFVSNNESATNRTRLRINHT